MHERMVATAVDGWTRRSLGHIATRVTQRNLDDNRNVLTISAKYGLVSQEEYFNRKVAGADLTQYFLINRGDFAYNKSYSSGYPAGVVRRLDLYDSGIVSPLYICFRMDRDVADSAFISQYFESGILNDAILGVAKEGVRNHGLLNVKVGDFFSLEVHLPPIEEQRRIAEILDAIDEQISCLNRSIAKIEVLRDGAIGTLLERPGSRSTPLSDLCLRIVDCPHSTPEYQDHGVLVARTASIKDGRFDVEGASYVSERGYRERVSRLEPRPGDVILTREAPVGEAFSIPSGMKICLGQRVMLLRPDPAQVRSEYLVLEIYSERFVRQVKDLVAGTTNPHLNVSDVHKMQIRIPEISTQGYVVQVSDEFQELLSRDRERLAKLHDLKRSVLSDLLVGRVRVPVSAER